MSVITPAVLTVLANDPASRTDDKRFLVQFYILEGIPSLTEEQKQWLYDEADSPWSALRIKKRIQQGGRFQDTSKKGKSS